MVGYIKTIVRNPFKHGVKYAWGNGKTGIFVGPGEKKEIEGCVWTSSTWQLRTILKEDLKQKRVELTYVVTDLNGKETFIPMNEVKGSEVPKVKVEKPYEGIKDADLKKKKRIKEIKEFKEEKPMNLYDQIIKPVEKDDKPKIDIMTGEEFPRAEVVNLEDAFHKAKTQKTVKKTPTKKYTKPAVKKSEPKEVVPSVNDSPAEDRVIEL